VEIANYRREDRQRENEQREPGKLECTVRRRRQIKQKEGGKRKGGDREKWWVKKILNMSSWKCRKRKHFWDFPLLVTGRREQSLNNEESN
jgi:hypothetical protein